MGVFRVRSWSCITSIQIDRLRASQGEKSRSRRETLAGVPEWGPLQDARDRIGFSPRRIATELEEIRVNGLDDS